MTRTPWGSAERLRDRMLPPGPGLPRDVVDANQRERLFAAMVATVTQRGYTATAVAEILELSGVSRNAFYRHFSNKEECFLAACDAIVEGGMQAVSAAYRRDAPWDRRLLAAFDAFVEVVVAQPAASRMCVVDIYAAGPAAIERADAAAAAFEELIRQSFQQSPERAGMPAATLRGLVGGVRKVVYTRLRRGMEGELRSLAPALGEWVLAYTTPPEPLRRVRARRPAAQEADLDGAGHVERIHAGVAAAVLAKGYPAMTVLDIVGAAPTSLGTFYSNFENKEDAFLSAYDAGRDGAFAATLDAYEPGDDWPYAFRGAIEALLRYLAAEPAWAHLNVVEVLAAGERSMERRDEALAAFEHFLTPGYELAPEVPTVAAEAISGAIYALAHEQIRRREAWRLPELVPTAVVIALSPFIGTEAACEVANDRRSARSSGER